MTSLSPSLLKEIVIVAGTASLILGVIWPRDSHGNAKNGRLVFVLTLLLAIATAVPGRELLVRRERLAELAQATNEKALADKALKVSRCDSILKLAFDENKSGLSFRSGESELDCSAKEKLAKIALYLQSENVKGINLVGHTDNRPSRGGDPNFNQYLSTMRAKSVAEYLEKAGVPPSRITVEGKSDHQPADLRPEDKNKVLSASEIAGYNKTGEQMARNRRVEFDLIQTTK